MTRRLDYNQVAPNGVKALGGVYGYVMQSGLPAELIELVYLRVSQINNCAYCLDMHTRDLIKKGVKIEKLALAQAWAEAGLPPAHASGVARATEDPLARTACFGRAAPPGAPPPSRFSATAVDHRRLRAAVRSCQPASPAGVLTERIDSLCNGKRDEVSRTKFPIMDLTPQGTNYSIFNALARLLTFDSKNA